MNTIDQLYMLYVPVKDMVKAKEFYADKLGFKVTRDYQQDDQHWWVTVELPDRGVSLSLSTYHGKLQPGNLQLYVSSPDIQAAHKQLAEKGAKTSAIQDDLYGPGSGVKWFELNDPDGNHWYVAQSKM